MNRTLKEAIVQRSRDAPHRQLEDHFPAFPDASNFARRLKALRGLTPCEAICKVWANEPERFKYDPTCLAAGLDT